jgi:hypothetical protein
MKHSTINNQERTMRHAEGKEFNSKSEIFKHRADQDKTDAKIEFYKRIQAARKAKRMQTEINY